MLKRRSSAAEAPTLPSRHAGNGWEGRVGAPAAPIKGFCGAAMQAPLNAGRIDAENRTANGRINLLAYMHICTCDPARFRNPQLRRTLGGWLTQFRREFHVQRQGRQVVDASAQAWPCQPARPFIFEPLNLEPRCWSNR